MRSADGRTVVGHRVTAVVLAAMALLIAGCDPGIRAIETEASGSATDAEAVADPTERAERDDDGPESTTPNEAPAPTDDAADIAPTDDGPEPGPTDDGPERTANEGADVEADEAAAPGTDGTGASDNEGAAPIGTTPRLPAADPGERTFPGMPAPGASNPDEPATAEPPASEPTTPGAGPGNVDPDAPIEAIPVPRIELPAPSPVPTDPGEQRVDYRIDGGSILNPERGWYAQRAPFGLGDERGVADMSRLRGEGETLIRLYFLIDEFRTSPISAEGLRLIEANFDEARREGVKVIPRFAYNFPNNGNYRDAEDAPLDRIIQHLDQLAPILERNGDVIAYLNLGFVGAWGEWHSSSNGHVDEGRRLNDNSRRIIEEIFEALPADRMATMRYPDYKRQSYGDEPLTPGEAHSGTPQARMGHLNDCVLASDTDWGTYPSDPAEREELKHYLSVDNQFVVMGGETCNEGSDATPYIGCSNARAELERMRWSTLHSGYHQGVLDLWRSQGCYDDIGRSLGYRFQLTTGTFPERATAGAPMSLTLSLDNAGFAAPYNPRGLELVFRHTGTGAETSVAIADDPRTWRPGSHRLAWSVPVPSTLPAGDYSLLLNLPDPEQTLGDRADYSIRLANAGTWEPASGYNDLGVTVTVD